MLFDFYSQELLEDGFSTEVENIQGDNWFEVMQVSSLKAEKNIDVGDHLWQF